MSERIIITIETENAAFDDEPVGEVVRILRHLAARFASDGQFPTVCDANGNTCGSVRVESI